MERVADDRGAGLEDELVRAAMQMSEQTKEIKNLKTQLDDSRLEISSLQKMVKERDVKLEIQKSEMTVAAALSESEREDMKKNELEAVETARKAYKELVKRNEEMKEMREALIKAQIEAAAAKEEAAKVAVAAAAASSSGLYNGCRSKPAAIIRGASAGTLEAAPVAGTPTSLIKRAGGKSRYSLEEEDEESGEGVRTPARGAAEDEGDDGEDCDGRGRGGLFGWLTGSGKKRRRGS